jgi:hypothetical protein
MLRNVFNPRKESCIFDVEPSSGPLTHDIGLYMRKLADEFKATLIETMSNPPEKMVQSMAHNLLRNSQYQ